MQEGFFTKKETESRSCPTGHILSCYSCGLYRKAKTHKMAPYGKFRKKILCIGEAPGEVEDQRGKPWQGRTGQLLEKTFQQLGIDLFEDCLNINACWCRPVAENNEENRAPTNYEMDCCRRFVLQIIDQYKPSVIIPLGSAAVYSLLNHRWRLDSLQGITRWRGWTIPDQDFGTWICPTFHPSYIERSEDGAERTIWLQDLKRALQKLEEPFPQFVKPRIDILNGDLTPLCDFNLGNNDNPLGQVVAIDFETTGLKPQAPGHRIICVAVADSSNHAFVFMLPPVVKDRKPLIDLLENSNIGKIAHNMKFEYTWSIDRLKTPIRNFKWDAMLAAHVLDNRKSITSLKFQVYVNFGIIDYSSMIEPYLETPANSTNALNRIQTLIANEDGKRQLLEYCAQDAVYEYRLAKRQWETISDWI